MSVIAAIDIAGAGAFGTALAITLANAGHPVTLWARQGAEKMQAQRQNTRRLPGHDLPPGIRVTGDLASLTSDILILAIPTQKLDGFLAGARLSAGHVISTAKGIHRATGLGPTGLIARALPKAIPAQLTGPSFAADLAHGLPTALTLACADASVASHLQQAVSTPALRLYTTSDVIGAELGGALKNVIAIAAGAVIGAGLGESARAALMARGFAEMRRVARAAGARDDTLSGLSGFGDLVLTCTSDKSRNFRFGAGLARGEAFDPEITVEGLATAQELAARPEPDTPIADAVTALAEGRLDFAATLETLLSRPLKPE
ncbi:NAD(P)H-dependent glycerol-3-phosphate dehydrogenase [Rhodophyticola sp. CCM32]|uniref:NAD(P)H-dependent glycerol-3-phosphate dehydrogenase n=1 Tax=Rhodophyticola sp. CCM32 TaxID=2916397 RepID=UPI00107F7C18|nr:NAD(P)H-dependent glycerol-3-phosphate dehydrogenase [Rhodophyticola sp. CCM32]QBY02397.1 NAD(P)H-dependent glycerol-3-phosphate dehydrogenase [Rhodophyticola sp. CCM32]